MVNASYILCITTTSSVSSADELALKIVKAGLGACVSISPIHSVFYLQDEVKKESEYQLTIKTKSSLSDKLQTFIKDNHSYDLPEIIFIPILSGDSNYLTWIHQTTN